MAITSNKFRSVCVGEIDITAPVPWDSALTAHLRHVTGFYWWPAVSPRLGGREKKFDTGEIRYDVLNWV